MVYTKATKDNKLPVKRKYDVKKQDNLPESPVFNLDELNKDLLSLTRELHQSLKAKRWFIFKGWDNRRIELDERRQRLLLEQIKNLGYTADELANTQAKIFLSTTVRDALIARNEKEIEIAFRKAEVELARVEDEMAQVGDIARARKAELDRFEMETRMAEMKAQAEINQINARTEKDRELTRIIREVVENLDFESLPPTLQTYIISSVFNPDGSQYTDFDMKEQLKELIKRNTEAEVEIKESQRDTAKAKAKLTVADFDKIRNPS